MCSRPTNAILWDPAKSLCMKMEHLWHSTDRWIQFRKFGPLTGPPVDCHVILRWQRHGNARFVFAAVSRSPLHHCVQSWHQSFPPSTNYTTQQGPPAQSRSTRWPIGPIAIVFKAHPTLLAHGRLAQWIQLDPIALVRGSSEALWRAWNSSLGRHGNGGR